MADWRLENKIAEVTRWGGWGFPTTKKNLAEALAWFSKYGYKAEAAWFIWNDDKTEKIGRQIRYGKPGVKTNYTMTIRF